MRTSRLNRVSTCLAPLFSLSAFSLAGCGDGLAQNCPAGGEGCDTASAIIENDEGAMETSGDDSTAATSTADSPVTAGGANPPTGSNDSPGTGSTTGSQTPSAVNVVPAETQDPGTSNPTNDPNPTTQPVTTMGTGDVPVVSDENMETGTPTQTPTEMPTETPTEMPVETPTETPAVTPTDTPAVTPTDTPAVTPTETPTVTEPSPNVDAAGAMNASPGDQTSVPSEYLRLGDLRLLNNRWGSDELGCSTTQRVFVNPDRSLGWEFNRPTCGGENAKPDYPEIEFGIHPFGIGSALETSPPFSSTTLLPLQIKDITSASVQVDNLTLSLGSANSWNLNFEFWLSERNPVEDANPGVYAELIGFWGWQDGRWPCDTSGSVTSGDRSYSLCHQRDDWADGQWRYFQFWVDGGPNTSYSGRVDIKVFLEWLVNNWGYSRDLWLTRLEIGSEIDDNTNGSVRLNNVTFEVNGTAKSVELAE